MTTDYPTLPASRTNTKYLMMLGSLLLIAIAAATLLIGMNATSAESSELTARRTPATPTLELAADARPVADDPGNLDVGTLTTGDVSTFEISSDGDELITLDIGSDDSIAGWGEHGDPYADNPFFACTEEIWSAHEHHAEDWEAVQDEIDAQTIERCLPLLPPDEQESYLANVAFGKCSSEIYDEAYANPATVLTDEDYRAIEDQVWTECFPLLPEAEQAEAAAWKAFDDCTMDAHADDALHLERLLARQACLDVLPEDLRGDQAAFVAHEICLAENTTAQGPWDTVGAGSITIHADELYDELIFGDEPGSITITSDGSTITFETSGDVAPFDWDTHNTELDQAYAACADLDQFAHEHLFPALGD